MVSRAHRRAVYRLRETDLPSRYDEPIVSEGKTGMSADGRIRLVGSSGSLREGSFNRKLLTAAARLLPSGAALEVMPIDRIPLYDADVEAESGIPAQAAALKDAIASADGLVIATPEYNGG